ncbi:glycosyl hydrolase [Chaetomium strumarium]|uniref:Glycosyl hydrolase n=1 Tax=Chaetomium strumarium TaxID=1170767 RepID=A0AAJ0M5C1_9PEZI|nr:glycosyl hydrolase [Chaetomium strumarium]
MHLPITTLPLVLLATTDHALARPHETLGNLDFADPSITYDPHSSAWYAFATQANNKHVQVATAPSPRGPWTYLPSTDLLPVPGSWVDTTSPRIWAPDVQYLSESDRFVLYYSGLVAGGSPYHCVGAATAENITGPYTAQAEPLICPLDEGGAIDAAGFRDESDGSRWVVYKVDGSAKGPGGPCGNGDPPGVPTPLRLQRVDETDGVTLVGEAETILDRDPELDGPLVEAPSLVRAGGKFVLFYSSHCFNSPDYDVKYATAERIQGPYTRKGQLIGKQAGDYGLEAPGGATGVMGGLAMVFHANCPAGRCMYETEYVLEGGEIKIPA